MDILQKTDTKTVQWFNKSEWQLVFDLIYADDSTPDKRAQALEIIKMWKVRNPFLPSGVEGTFIILQGIEKDETKLSSYDLQVIYSTAVLRFLNICAAHNTKQGTFSMTAFKQNIPRWVIDMRHDIAHGSNLPKTDALKRALDFSFKWLYNEYWHPVSLTLLDYVVDFEELNTESPKKESKYYSKYYSDLEFLVSAIECLTVFQHTEFKLKSVGDIPDENLKSCFLTELRWFGNCFAGVSGDSNIRELNKSILEYLEKYLRGVGMGIKKIVVQLLLESDTFLCDLDLQTQIFKTADLNDELPWPFVRLWQDFLTKLHQLSLMEHLLYKLFEIVNSEVEPTHRRKIAAFWIHEISKGFKKLHFLQNSLSSDLEKMPIDDSFNQRKINKKLSMEFEQNHPEMKPGLRFDAFVPVPSILQDIKILYKVALTQPNEFTPIFLKNIVGTIDPPLNKDAAAKLSALVNSFVHTGSPNLNSDKVFTVEDLKIIPSNKTCVIDDDIMDTNVDDILSKYEPKVCVEEDEEIIDPDNEWKLAPAHISFQNVPLGLLPGQADKINPTLAFFIK